MSEGGRERWSDRDGKGGRAGRERYRQGKCPRFPWCLLESETKSRSTAVRCVTDKTVNRETDSIRGYLLASNRILGNLAKEDVQVVWYLLKG